MAKDVFSVPIFFIVFREALEASIVISVLLALVEQIAHTPLSLNSSTQDVTKVDDQNGTKKEGSEHSIPQLASNDDASKALIKRMRIQVMIGAGAGLFISLAIGAAFLAVWFTQTNDIFGANEEIWEGVFNLVAALIIFPMALTMLRIDKAKSKWRVKLQRAFLAEQNSGGPSSKFAKFNIFKGCPNDDLTSRGSRWTLFLLPFITILREGLEAVVFIGGVSLGQEATSIPLAAIVGLLCGFLIGYIIYLSSSRTALSIFLIISTNFLLLIGAGLFSKSVGNFERHQFNKMVGADVAEAGNGPGSYDVRGNIWHLNCCNPEDKFGSQGWTIFAAIFGWSNNGSVGTVLSYIFYWIAAIVALVVMNLQEKKQARRAHTA